MKLSRLLKEAREQVDRTNPIYRRAREAARPGRQFEPAYEEGQKFVSDNIGEIAERIGRFDPISQTGYRMGALEGLKKKIGSTRRNDYAGPVSGEYQLDRLREMAMPQYRDVLPEIVESERQLVDNTRWLHNSNTAEKVAGQADLASQVGVINQAARGGVRGMATAAVDKVLMGLARRFDLTEKHLADVAKILMEQNPMRVEAHLRRIAQDMDNARWRALRERILTARKALVVGRLAGRFGGMKQGEY